MRLRLSPLPCLLLLAACSTDPTATDGGTGGGASHDGTLAGGNPGTGGGDSSSGGAMASSGGGLPASGGIASSGGQGENSSGGAFGNGGSSNAGGSNGESGDTGSGGTDGGGRSPEGGAAGSGGSPQGGGGPALPSSGCDGTAPLPPSGLQSLDVDGTTREFILDLPANYDSAHPYRLVFGFHGLMYDAAWVAEGGAPLTGPYFGLEEQAEGSTIFLAPQALSGGWSDQNGRDIALVQELLSLLTTRLCIDESRIFSAGFSFGAIMTINIGCQLSDRFRAIAPMSGSLQGGCGQSDPLAYLGTHGLSDTTIPPESGQAVRDLFLERNSCSSMASAPDENGCVRYEGCTEGAPVTWCTFEGEHVPAPFAGEVIWNFFSQF